MVEKRNSVEVQFLGSNALRGFGDAALSDVVNNVVRAEQVESLTVADPKAASALVAAFGLADKVRQAGDSHKTVSGWCLPRDGRLFHIQPR